MSDDRLRDLRQAQARHAALESALRLLAYRPRSEAEIRERLARKGVPADVAEGTMRQLRDLALIDDELFARFLVESRDRTSPRARRLLAAELRGKGIERGIAVSSVAALSDEDAAHRAAARRASSLAALPHADFRRRLSEFLLRRGFDCEITRSTVTRLWGEAARGATPDEE